MSASADEDEDAVYLVITGNSKSHVFSIEQSYTNPEAARRHKRWLIYNGKAFRNSEYVDIRKYTPSSSCNFEPEFEYRLYCEDNDDTSDWVESYNRVRSGFKEFKEEYPTARVVVQRRNANADIEETTRASADPWENSWTRSE